MTVAPGKYNVKRNKLYLAIKADKTVGVQGKAFTWTVSVHGNHNCLKDPASDQYLHDDCTSIVLDPGENKHGRWEGASLTKHTKLVNDGTENPLNFPYGGEGDTWIFELAD